MENENLKPIEKLTPFTKMIMTIGTLPSSFYASMSYYESMVWLYEYLKNEVIPCVNNNAEAVSELQEKFLELKEWCETYVEETIPIEVKNKLDEMAEDGTLTSLIYEYLNKNSQIVFNNVEEMKNSENITNGSFIKTYGFYSINDGGNALYKIRLKTENETIDEMTLISLNDETLVAELIINDEINLKQLGAKANGTNDDTMYLLKAISLNKEINGNFQNFKISSMIITNSFIINNCNFVCDSSPTPETVIFYIDDENVIVEFNNCTFTTTCDQDYDNNGTTILHSNLWGLHGHKIKELKVDNCIFTNFTLPFKIDYTSKIYISNSLLDNPMQGIYSNGDEFTLINTKIKQFPTANLYLHCIYIPEDCKIIIDNCDFIGNRYLLNLHNASLSTKSINANIYNSRFEGYSGISINGIGNLEVYNCYVKIEDNFLAPNNTGKTIIKGCDLTETTNISQGSCIIDNCDFYKLSISSTGNNPTIYVQNSRFKEFTISGTGGDITFKDCIINTYKNNYNIGIGSSASAKLKFINTIFNSGAVVFNIASGFSGTFECYYDIFNAQDIFVSGTEPASWDLAGQFCIKGSKWYN